MTAASPIAMLASLALAGCSVRDLHCAPPVAFRPWDEHRPAPRETIAPAEDLADALVAYYQRHLRAATRPGEGCRLRPSCSEFARIALRKWRVVGFALVADRLFVREHPWMTHSYLLTCDGDDHREAWRDPVP